MNQIKSNQIKSNQIKSNQSYQSYPELELGLTIKTTLGLHYYGCFAPPPSQILIIINNLVLIYCSMSGPNQHYDVHPTLRKGKSDKSIFKSTNEIFFKNKPRC